MTVIICLAAADNFILYIYHHSKKCLKQSQVILALSIFYLKNSKTNINFEYKTCRDKEL